MIGVPAAHKVTTGSKAVTVAILDTGFAPPASTPANPGLNTRAFTPSSFFNGVRLSDSFGGASWSSDLSSLARRPVIHSLQSLLNFTAFTSAAQCPLKPYIPKYSLKTML